MLPPPPPWVLSCCRRAFRICGRDSVGEQIKEYSERVCQTCSSSASSILSNLCLLLVRECGVLLRLDALLCAVRPRSRGSKDFGGVIAAVFSAMCTATAPLLRHQNETCASFIIKLSSKAAMRFIIPNSRYISYKIVLYTYYIHDNSSSCPYLTVFPVFTLELSPVGRSSLLTPTAPAQKARLLPAPSAPPPASL